MEMVKKATIVTRYYVVNKFIKIANMISAYIIVLTRKTHNMAKISDSNYKIKVYTEKPGD